MWKVFVVIILLGGPTGDGKDDTAEFVSKKDYSTQEACKAVLPGVRKYWEERIAKVTTIKGKDGKDMKPKLEIKNIHCSNEEVIK